MLDTSYILGSLYYEDNLVNVALVLCPVAGFTDPRDRPAGETHPSEVRFPICKL